MAKEAMQVWILTESHQADIRIWGILLVERLRRALQASNDKTESDLHCQEESVA